MTNVDVAPRAAAAVLLLVAVAPGHMLLQEARFGAEPRPASSSPITLSANDALVWTVNPHDDSVAVIRADTNRVIANLAVGDEPRSIAVSPDDRIAYVANAADASVTPIRIQNANPDRFRARAGRAVVTGAEPWSVVVSPDGARTFVANSAEDTITVLRTDGGQVIGHVDLRNSLCNDPDRERHFQPRALAVTADSRRLFVTRFLSFVREGGVQATDTGREGFVCMLDIDTASNRIGDYTPVRAIPVPPAATGFKVDSDGDGQPDETSAFPNQLQNIVIRGDIAYLPNVAAAPAGPLRFDVSSQAFVNMIGGINGDGPRPHAVINLNLGGRAPEREKKRLFFANPWAIAFTTESGAGSAYVVAAGSDLLVKLDVTGDGSLRNTGGPRTTRYIDLNDPENPATSGDRAGKNPRGLAITADGTRAYVTNFVSRNVSVVDLTSDSVVDVIRTTPLPAPGTREEELQVGAEMFYSSRGHFNRPASTGMSDGRLSMEGWLSCATCHPEGLSDGVVWSFPSGPRKTLPLNGSFNPRDPENGQRIFNFGATFDELEDFDAVVRDVQGPGLTPLAAPIACSDPLPDTTRIDPDHGLIVGDNGELAVPPCEITPFGKANANRREVTVTPPGSSTAVRALTALKKWVQSAVRTPGAPQPPRDESPVVSRDDIQRGRQLFERAGCVTCHGGPQWTTSIKDFDSPPSAVVEGFSITERTGEFEGNPVGTQYLNRFLRDIGSFNIGVEGQGNPLGANIGAIDLTAAPLAGEVAQPRHGGLGRDYNGDGRGNGFNVPSLLGVYASPPYLHNGACETLACVVSDVRHRTANGAMPDILRDREQQMLLVRFLESITPRTEPFPLR